MAALILARLVVGLVVGIAFGVAVKVNVEIGVTHVGGLDGWWEFADADSYMKVAVVEFGLRLRRH